MKLNSRSFLIILLCFVLGVAVGSFFSIALKLSQILFFVSAILVIVVGLFDKTKILLLVFILAFLTGIVRFNIDQSYRGQLKSFADLIYPVTLRGYVDNAPERLEDKTRFIFKAKEIIAENLRIPVNDRILITVEPYPVLHYADSIQIKAKLKTPQNFSDFDYAGYLAKDDVYTISSYPKIEFLCNDMPCSQKLSRLEVLKLKLIRPIFVFKQRFQAAIEDSISEPNTSFIEGILLGSNSGIDPDLKENARRTGTSHIFAISGWNITIISQIVTLFLLIFFRRPTAFWFTLVFLGAFVLLTGASASVIRAAIMGTLILLAYRQGRFYNITNAIVLAGAVMLALNPKVLRFDVGFQLSFLATLGLVFISPIFSKKLEKMPGWLGLKESLIATCVATIAILPVAVANFKQISLVSIPVNILVLPIIPWTMLLGFLSGLASLVSVKLGIVVGYPAWIFSKYCLEVIRFFANSSFALVEFSWHWIFGLIYYILLTVFIIRARKKKVMANVHTKISK